jgi:hypothetical protein
VTASITGFHSNVRASGQHKQYYSRSEENSGDRENKSGFYCTPWGNYTVETPGAVTSTFQKLLLVLGLFYNASSIV